MSKSIESRIESLENKIGILSSMVENLGKRIELEEDQSINTDVQLIALQAAVTFLLADARHRDIDVDKFKNKFINALKEKEPDLPDEYGERLTVQIESLFS